MNSWETTQDQDAVGPTYIGRGIVESGQMRMPDVRTAVTGINETCVWERELARNSVVSQSRCVTVIMTVVMTVIVTMVMGMVVIMTAVTVIMAMMMVIGWRGRNVTPLSTKSGELQCPGEEHQRDQPRNIDRLLDEIADFQSEEVDPLPRRGDISPDQDRHGRQQDDADPAPASQQRPQSLPIHRTKPEGDPTDQGQPRPQQ